MMKKPLTLVSTVALVAAGVFGTRDDARALPIPATVSCLNAANASACGGSVQQPTILTTPRPVIGGYIAPNGTPTNYSCPGALLTGSGTGMGYYNCLSGYVDIYTATVQQAQPASVYVPYTLLYMDVSNPCPDSAASLAAGGQCKPNADQTTNPSPAPEAFFAHDSGQRVVENQDNTKFPNSSSTPGPSIRYQTDYGNAAATILSYVNGFLAANVANYMSSFSAQFAPIGFFFDDNGDPTDGPVPAPSASPPVAGTFFYHWATGANSAVNATRPWSGFNDAAWQSGLGSTIQGLNANVMANLSGSYQTGPGYPATSVATLTNAQNVFAILQEYTWSAANNNSQQPARNLQWVANENAISDILASGKIFVDLEHITCMSNGACGSYTSTPQGSSSITSAVTTTGSQAVTSGVLQGITTSTALTIDTGGQQETVTPTAVSNVGFTANFTKTHASGATFTWDCSGNSSCGLYQRTYAYASDMLLMDNMNRFKISSDYTLTYGSYVTSASGVSVPVEGRLIPTSPYVATPAAWSSANPITTGVWQLQDTTQASGSTYACPIGPSTGVNCAFVREFANCYLSQHSGPLTLTPVSIGRCAAVVMPHASGVSDPFPTLSHSYTHTLSFSGFDIVPGTTDEGTVSALGPAPPAAGSLQHAQQAWILTQ